ncbi:MAG: efflux RND transporter permease subunit [Jaaginema sp. PMC 1079.18]|nr:efflux RND transporter permease subunit [Jaaginema sp. PMC 1080.18]MEC4849807.1 efflux RND transporter permease subunit [Jaaginema sp. PMC 1079.18]MEC4866889.1 efflux RND transporter permease subunit [Jaaginema sp. PMC 1078.18]
MVRFPGKSSLRQRLNLSRWAIAHPWLTVGFWIAVTVAGLMALSSLKYALFPDVTFPVVVVQAQTEAKTALDTEAELTLPLETALQNSENLEQYRSSTYAGRAIANLEFAVGTDLPTATTAVRSQLDQVDFPPETTFEVIPFNLNESASVSYALESQTLELEELIDLAKTAILPPITAIEGVLRVNLQGNSTPPQDREAENIEIDSQQTLVRFNGNNALAFQVVKRNDANTLEIVADVEAMVEELRSQFPQVTFTLAETQADFIREATQATIDALILAIILAVLVIYPFLGNIRATLITALAIPTSLLGTCIVMAIAGFNLETITLLALALVIGIIVDDAIVDVENIARHIEAGESPREAAINGTDEIGLTVTASTLTIVAVFLPVALMGGTIGQFFKPFGLTVSAAVLISLLVARTLSPVLAIWWLRPRRNPSENAPATIPVDNDNELLPNSSYRGWLRWALNHRGWVIAIAIVSFVIGLALIPLIPQGFIPQLDRGEFNIVYTNDLPELPQQQPENVTPPPSPPSADSEFGEGSFDWLKDLTQSPIRLLLARSRNIAAEIEINVLDHPDVESVFSLIGLRGEPNKGKLYVRLKPTRALTTAQIQAQIRKELPDLENVTIGVEDIQFVDTIDQKPLQIVLLGDDIATLTAAAQSLQKRIAVLPGFVEVTVTGEEDPINPNRIERLNGQRAVYFASNLASGKALGDATTQVLDIAEEIIPDDISLDLKGDAASSSDVFASFGTTLTLAVICMLVVLFLPFGRLLEPLVVGLSLPLAIVGAMLALLITQSDFGMISLIGLIFLLGLLDKNALLLMDYINQLRRSGMARSQAIIQTGQVRLRPILMTTFSTILGMLPIALGWGAGAELRQPMAVAIIGGLLTSTLLSLIIVPVLYALLEDAWSSVTRRFQGKS